MIVVDTSALMAIVLREAEAARCREALLGADHAVMSAATLAEALIVAMGKNASDELIKLVDAFEIGVEPVTRALAVAAAGAYRAWGKRRHAASLNYGDCFSYALAFDLRCPLLFVGADFSQTDITAA